VAGKQRLSEIDLTESQKLSNPSGAATGDEHRSTQAPSAGAPDPKTDPAFRAWAEMRAMAGKPLLLRCINLI
jgi:hypothetical protein